jgi:pimeloyl-ACP methyl ester carboxylesterase
MASEPHGEKMIPANGAELCTQAFGDPADPAVLLIMGAMTSMLWWPEGFCRRLAAAGRYVIRYDNRDTGRSTSYPPGQPGYSLDDMAADALAILDAYGTARAHFAGMSLGGMIAQIVALQSPERVATLTLLSSSIFGPAAAGLPPVDPKILEYHQSGAALNWSDAAAVTDYMANGWRLLTGGGRTFDEAAMKAIAAGEVARARNLTSMFNHALLKGGERWYGKGSEIRVPTVVIHGTDDPVLPYPHGVALAKEIPGAKLVTLEGAGHELHRDDWDAIVRAIIFRAKSGN